MIDSVTMKLKVASVSKADPATHMHTSAFFEGWDRIYVSAMREDLEPASPPEGLWDSMPEPVPYDVKIRSDEDGEEKDAKLTLPRREAKRMMAQMSQQMLANRNPTVLPITEKEYEALGRPTVGDRIEVSVRRSASTSVS